MLLKIESIVLFISFENSLKQILMNLFIRENVYFLSTLYLEPKVLFRLA